MHYILVDYENVQPKNIRALDNIEAQILIFIGANQDKLPFELVATMQALGPKAAYVKITETKPNALDFHLSYYLGQLSANDKNGYFHIVSKDKGYDPLIRHLQTKKIRAERSDSFDTIKAFKASAKMNTEEKVTAIVVNLQGRGQSKPRKIPTLSNTIRSIFTPKLSDKDAATLVQQLVQRKFIEVKDSNVSYRLPSVKRKVTASKA